MILLARLAVELSARGQRLGELLLVVALRRSAELAERIGIHAVEVDAIDEEAQAFYLKYGFVPLKDRELHLYRGPSRIGPETSPKPSSLLDSGPSPIVPSPSKPLDRWDLLPPNDHRPRCSAR